MRNFKSSHAAAAIATISLLLFSLSGCSDDDSPYNPGGGGGGGGDTFDQQTAQVQAQAAAPQAIGMVESVSTIAAGVNKQGDYGWNADMMRWEYDYVYTVAGYSYDWMYTVQYRDGSGTPQMDVAGASSVAHTMNGTGTYSSNQGGFDIDYDYVYEYDTVITGLGGNTYTMTGDGGYSFDYTYSGSGVNQSSSYQVDWTALSPGVMVPANGGCPTGTIRYTFTPYTMDMVFDGSSTATASMSDGVGNSVPLTPDTYDLSCTTR